MDVHIINNKIGCFNQYVLKQYMPTLAPHVITHQDVNKEIIKTVANKFVTPHLHYKNDLLHSIKNKVINTLQVTQNSRVRLIEGLKRHNHCRKSRTVLSPYLYQDSIEAENNSTEYTHTEPYGTTISVKTCSVEAQHDRNLHNMVFY